MTPDEHTPHEPHEPREPREPAMGDADEHAYLWDRSGAPDPEIVALERALGAARWQATPRAPQLADARRRGARVAAAAIILIALGASVAGLWSAVSREGTSGEATYRAEALSGAIAHSELGVGDRLQTDGATRALLTIGELGSVLVEPDSRVRIEATGSGATSARAPDAAVPHRIFLEQGALTASIFAAPRLFAVGTPSGLAVDLGCVYTARVEEDGGTLLSVVLGQVAFEAEGRKVTVPSGASAHASPGSGPGTPVRDDAPPGYRAAVAHLDASLARLAGDAGGELTPEARNEMTRALDEVLATDRTGDSLTLWHLLAWPAVPPPECERVLFALAALAPPPADVRSEDCLARDAASLQRWRETLVWAW